MRIAQKKTVVQRSSSSAAEITASPASDGSAPLIPNTSQYSTICAPSITRRAPPSIRPTRGMMRRSGASTGSVSFTTNCDSGL